MTEKTFSDAACRKFRCSPEAYSEAVFWHCLHPHAVPFAKIIRRLSSGFFARDFELIRYLANTTDVKEFRKEVEDFRYYNPVSGLMRGMMRIRVSGLRLLKLAAELLVTTTQS
jgi:hypothetical protein